MNSAVCVDASLIVRTFVPGAFSEAAEALLARWQQAQTPLIAPALLAFEVTSTLRRMVYLKALTPARGDEAADLDADGDLDIPHPSARG